MYVIRGLSKANLLHVCTHLLKQGLLTLVVWVYPLLEISLQRQAVTVASAVPKEEYSCHGSDNAPACRDLLYQTCSRCMWPWQLRHTCAISAVTIQKTTRLNKTRNDKRTTHSGKASNAVEARNGSGEAGFILQGRVHMRVSGSERVEQSHISLLVLPLNVAKGTPGLHCVPCMLHSSASAGMEGCRPA